MSGLRKRKKTHKQKFETKLKKCSITLPLMIKTMKKYLEDLGEEDIRIKFVDRTIRFTRYENV